MPSLEIEWLEDFLEVAEQRNFTRAATARGLNQSTLSRHIQSLEAALGGIQLLRRDAGLELTEAGTAFRDDAKKLLLDFRFAKTRIEQMKPLPPASARIYTPHSLAATFVPRVIHKLRELLDDEEFDINFVTVIGTISDCTEALAYSAAPFMISFENERHRLLFSDDRLTDLFPTYKPHVQREQIQSIRIARDKLIPVCARSNHRKYRDMFEANLPLPYIAYSDGTYLSELVETKIQQLNLADRLKRVGDAQMADTLRNLAREREGIAWVLTSTAQRALVHEIVPFDFDTDSSGIDIDIKLFRRADYHSPTIERIWRVSKQLENALAVPATWIPDSIDHLQTT